MPIISYVKDDLLNTDLKYIAHGCNARGKYGKGVAKLIREKYPEAYEEYMRIHNSTGLLLGDYSVAKSGNKYIFNFVTQDRYGTDGAKYVSYDAIWNVFHNFDMTAKNILDGYVKLAIPKIGCSLGGGDWNVVSAIIDSITPHTRVYVYDPGYAYTS